MKKLIYCFFCALTLFGVFSCFNEQEEAEIKTSKANFFTNNGYEVKTETKNNSAWKPADKIEAKIIAEENEIRIKFDFSKLKNELLNGIVDKGDTLRSTIFNMQLMCNGKLMTPYLVKGKFTICEDSSCTFYTSVVRLRSNMLDRVEIPFYALKDYPAGSNVQLQLRLWQDCFVGEEIWAKKNKAAMI
ncbi:MAG: hypothetical protein IPG89_14885 [Bacteroidetes bacterium]|nr:hypothetical protein [Bacteroidota bacterium]